VGIDLGPRRTTTLNDFLPYLRYNATSGTFSDKDDQNIDFRALVDLENILTGWAKYERGSPPDLRWDPGVGKAPPSPGKGFRRGFQIRVFFSDGRGLRELTSSSSGLCHAIVDIYNQFEVAPERTRGLVPEVMCVGTTSAETPFGRLYDPTLSIIGWQPRPRDLAPPPPATPVSSASAPTTTAVVPSARDALDDEIPF